MSRERNANNTADGIFKRLSDALAGGSYDVKSATNEFMALNSNCARVNFAYGLLESYVLFPRVAESCKSDKVAGELREAGNRLFKIKNDELALVKYTESIAYAPSASEDLGLAFANRSAVLFEQKLYNECLKDIANAFSNNYPKRLHEKLLQRKSKAESLKSNQPLLRYHQEPPALSYAAHNFIECASDCVEIKFEENLGRHIVSTRDIQVGDVIAIESPFTQVLPKERYLTHCYHCLRPCYNLIACNNCPLVLFCSEDCKSTSWNSCHKYECPILATLLNLQLNKLTLVALKICMCAEGAEELNKDANTTLKGSKYKSQNYHEIHNLIANTDIRPAADLFERAVTAAIIYNLVEKETRFMVNAKEEDENVFKELLLLHMQTAPSNFHEISELVISVTKEDFYEIVEIGAGAYAFLSLLNHSCCPNVVRHCYGSSIVLRALRPIAKGEQLFDNYGYHHAGMVKSERQDQLKKQYYFLCKCEACTDNWPLYADLPVKNFIVPITDSDINDLQKGKEEVARKIFTGLQKTLGTIEISKPCKEIAYTQETLKQCYSIFANKRITF